MANKGVIETNLKRARLSKQYDAKRQALKAIVMDKTKSIDERFQAQLKLSKLPRNGSRNRVRNRCLVTGRPRGYYRKFKMSRIALRDYASLGLIPGVIKSSW